MFIERLDLENFGPFSGEVVDGLGPGLNVIHGRNETGKSALRAFLRAILFGFPRGRLSKQDTWLYVYPPAHGGEAAGSVRLVTGRGARYGVRRREGAHGGPVEVWGDEQGSGDLLSELLGRIGPELYQNVFSISLSELQDYESMKQAGVRDRIYSAGLGLVGISLPDAMKKLEDERSASSGLWSPQSWQLRKLLREFGELRTQLEEARGRQASYADLGRQLDGLRERDSEYRDRIQKLRSEDAMLRKLLELRPHWIRAESWSRRIQQLPDVSGFPRHGVAALESLRNEEARLQEALEAGESDQERRRREAANLPIVSVFEARAADVERLLGEIEYYKAAIRDLPQRRRELEDEEAALTRELSSLGPAWDESTLEATVDIPALQSRLRVAGDALTNAVQARDAAAGRVEYRRERRGESEAAVREAQARVEAVNDPPRDSVDELEARYGLWERVRRALIERSSLERDLREHESRLAESRVNAAGDIRAGRLTTAASAMAAVVGIVFAALGTAEAQPLAIAAGLLLGATGVAGLWRAYRHQRPSRSAADSVTEVPVATLERVRSDLAAQLDAKVEENRGLLEALSAAEPRSEAEAQENIDRLRREIDRRKDFDRLRENLEESQRQLSQDQEREGEAVSRFTETESAVEEATRTWRNTLEAIGLNTDLQPADAQATVERIHRVLQRHGNVLTLRRRVREISEAVEDLEERLRAVIVEAGMPDFEALGGSPSLEHLQGRYDEHRAAVQKRRTLAEADAEWEANRTRIRESLGEIKAKREDLFARAGVPDEAAFRELGERAEERDELERKLADLKDNHPELFDEAGTEYTRRLDSATDEDLEASRQMLKSDIEAAERERDEILNQVGSIERDRRVLEEENPVAQIRNEISQIEERSRELGGRWAVLTLAKHFIEATRDEFQRDRQAPLLQSASAQFRRFTGGRYTSVQNVIGEERIVVTDDEMGGRQKEVGALSRGTREQLLLAMRFALIDEYVRKAESLPVLMDDVMVNFDPERSRAVSEGVADLATRHQVLVLTCHPSTIEALAAASKAVGYGEPRLLHLSEEEKQLSLSAGGYG